MTATIQRFDVAQETPAEREFYRTCELGDISFPHHYNDYGRPTCSKRVTSLMWCNRTAGHAAGRCVAESDTTVLAASAPTSP